MLGEAARLPEFSQHVAEPKPCRVIFGLSPAEVQTRHDEMVAAGWCEVTFREAGQRAISELHTQLATQREEIERQIGEVGSELAALAADRDVVRADLEHFAALRDRLGIHLVDGRSQPVIIAPEGQEIRPWRAAGLHELARYNGRMYRVMARE